MPDSNWTLSMRVKRCSYEEFLIRVMTALIISRTSWRLDIFVFGVTIETGRGRNRTLIFTGPYPTVMGAHGMKLKCFWTMWSMHIPRPVMAGF